MQIMPLSKAIYERATAMGIETIELEFRGGSDEGFLEVTVSPRGEDFHSSFEADIEEWVWTAYDYNGAGDGQEYGDEIKYDLKGKKAVTSEWYMSRQDGDPEEMELETEQ
jgi:hypothetical protein